MVWTPMNSSSCRGCCTRSGSAPMLDGSLQHEPGDSGATPACTEHRPCPRHPSGRMPGSGFRCAAAGGGACACTGSAATDAGRLRQGHHAAHGPGRATAA
ncbi:hypothetical protein G6F35_015933 [Rhizopus arrhizus]|nr:hypothetical protein G6F35_015933 [Rhizopus arrhizus]